MLHKIIIEAVLVLGIIFAVTGIPTAEITEHKVESADNGGICDCKYDNYENLRIRVGISKPELKEVYNGYFAEKQIEYDDKTSVFFQYIEKLFILAIYFLLITFISKIVSENSSKYYYYLLPVYDILAFIFTTPSRIRNKREDENIANEMYIKNNLDNMMKDVNQFIRK